MHGTATSNDMVSRNTMSLAFYWSDTSAEIFANLDICQLSFKSSDRSSFFMIRKVLGECYFDFIDHILCSHGISSSSMTVRVCIDLYVTAIFLQRNVHCRT